MARSAPSVTRWRRRSLLPRWGGGGHRSPPGSVLPPFLFRQALAGAPPTPGGLDEGGAPGEHRPLRPGGTCRHAQACGHQQGLCTPLPVPCPRLVWGPKALTQAGTLGKQRSCGGGQEGPRPGGQTLDRAAVGSSRPPFPRLCDGVHTSCLKGHTRATLNGGPGAGPGFESVPPTAD